MGAGGDGSGVGQAPLPIDPRAASKARRCGCAGGGQPGLRTPRAGAPQAQNLRQHGDPFIRPVAIDQVCCFLSGQQGEPLW